MGLAVLASSAAPEIRRISDAELATRLRRRDQEALAEIYERHHGAVAAVAGQMLDQWSRDEVVQEVFLALWHRPERFQPQRGRLCTYLRAQARSRSIDRLRAEGARRRRQERCGFEQRDMADADLAAVVLELLSAEHVRAAIHTLPSRERVAIELAFFRGHSYRQVAALLGQPEGTVKARIRTGLARLRLALVAIGVSLDA